MKQLFKRAVIALLLAGALGAALIWYLNTRGEPDMSAPQVSASATPEQIERGAYLARAGNCATCHTARGGLAYAGGLALPTPFGTIYSSNLTPDASHGLGRWPPVEFWRALHNGRSKDGRLLYAAFPYPNYTRVTREDSNALFAYLQSLSPVTQPNRPHELRWPYNTQPALAVWRALFFRPGEQPAQPARSAEWNRGAYLVNGLGHCSACHAPRNAMGASEDESRLDGGLIPVQNWYAPSLANPNEAGVASWPTQDVVRLLKTGVSAHSSVSGPMSDIVLKGMQYLNDADLTAVATFLKELTPTATLSAPVARVNAPLANSDGGKLYTRHCAQCHGDDGAGIPGAYPALGGNRAVTMTHTANLVQIVLNGAYPPATTGNPRPFGMPPFALELNDRDLSTLLTYVRSSWGNQASEVSALEASKYRGGQR
ncbi:MAG: cytochrome c [Burkholderiaceae bacterium]|nr:cytochrome c [Burkholderiaceae bacterium]